MSQQPNSTIFALVRIQHRGSLMQQITKRNTSLSGCSLYYFYDSSALLTKLGATPDERSPTLIALAISLIRTDDIDSLSYLRSSKRLRIIPTLLLESSARSFSVTAVA